MAPKRTELLAPAGSFDAACAAFRFGADAVYLGLKSHSARAEAVNFTPEELAAVTAFAHGLSPRRAVYLAANTLIRDDEVRGVADTLGAAADACVDGVIVQDIGVYRLARRYFPSLSIHASTQMCVHNEEGARAMKDLGFSRVVFARELTLREIAAIAAAVDIETEVFIHGALCYGYSGLCLFSALSAGRSGNRGRCAYCCRERFSGADGTAASFPFSMRDLDLGRDVLRLRDAGVTSLKIEGRMKSPLYVAAATALYRAILDGAASDAEICRAAEDLRTVFSRPSTKLYLDGPAPPESVIDPETVGHRGAPIGTVAAVVRDGARRFLRFRPSRAVEVHDGLQVDLPGRPFGFSVGTLRDAARPRRGTPVFSLPAGVEMEVELPPDAPQLPRGAQVFCSSSQAVHRKFSFDRPRASETARSEPLPARVTLAPGGATACAILRGVEIAVSMPAVLTPARNPALTAGAVAKAFGRTGESRWRFEPLDIDDPLSLYAPPSLLNELRRKACAALDEADGRRKEADKARQLETLAVETAQIVGDTGRVPEGVSVKVEFAGDVRRLECDEAVVAFGADDCGDIDAFLARAAEWRKANGRTRFALPAIARGAEADVLCRAVAALWQSGVADFECADLAGLHAVRRICGEAASIVADASLYSFNKLAALQLRDLGVDAAVAPAEAADGELAELISAAGGFIIVPERIRPPLFISETRPLLPENARELVDRRGNQYTVECRHERWITRQAEALVHDVAGAVRRRRDFTDE